MKAESGLVWQVCAEELRRRGFRLDRVDRRTGVMETVPQVSGQWFEIWKQDAATAAARAEASLHTMRRSVRLEVQDGEDMAVRVMCRVFVERLAFAPAEWSGAVRAADVMAGTMRRAHVRTVFYEQRREQMRWIEVGEDAALAAAICAGIAGDVPQLQESRLKAIDKSGS